MKGTAPPGATGEAEAARWVRGMFGRVAGRYDLLNHLLSFNIDRHWRAHTVRRLRPVLDRPGARVLDLCCGTGDLTLAFQRACPNGLIIGGDFSHPMLERAARKGAARLIEADALALPVTDGSLDLIATAFGFRNLANYEKGLAEMRRALKPGGTLAILEFSQPPGRTFAAFYSFYSNRVLPLIGGALSGVSGAYRYLPESVRRFPSPEDLAQMMREAGFADVTWQRLTAGIVALHLGH